MARYMADGGIGGSDVAKVEIVRVRRAGGIAYAYAPMGERSAPFAGNLNVAAKKEKFALAPWRVGRFAFTASRAVDGGVNYLQIAEGDVSLFNVGSGGAYTAANGGMTGTASDAESKAGAQGAIVRNGATFVAVGLEIVREKGWFTPAASAANQLGVRDVPDWISDNGPTGFDYRDAAAELIEQAAFFRYQLFPNTQIQEQRCGALADWMSRGSKINLPGTFVAFTSEYGSGGQKTSSQLQSFVTLGGDPQRTLRVQERLGLTLPATGSVVIPYAMRLWGYTVCGDPPDDDICAVPGASAQSLTAVLEYMKQCQAMLAQGQINREMFDRMMVATTAQLGAGGENK
jgi:hypothetical protein